MSAELSLSIYFQQWMEVFKKPAITPVTYVKYQNTLKHINTYFGDINIRQINRQVYQIALNKFALTHAKRTTSGFHKHIRAAILDAIEEGHLEVDFTRKAIITGREITNEKVKFLSYSEWQSLIRYTCHNLDTSYNLIIYLSAMTGLRFAEVLGLTVEDVDFHTKRIIINKTWDYKYQTGFINTKTSSSVRMIDLDNSSLQIIQKLIDHNNFSNTDKICVDKKGKLPVSATINRYLEKLCAEINISPISFHGLRHTHASILLFKGVNIISVSKRLGHKDVTTTQSVYLHIIKEMEDRETKLITNIMFSALND